jgi:two-component system nitrogen regulation response regulator GlnG
VRIVSATHRDLGEEVHGGRFRQDLYYRLNVICINLPPLRERASDLALICRAVLERIARDAGVTPVPTISADALRFLSGYAFPGNVRELENLLRRLVAIEIEDTIPASAIERELASFPVQPSAEPMDVSGASLPEFIENYLSRYFASFGSSLPPQGLYERILSEVEPPLLRAVLAATSGNQLRAAELLGINRNTLRVKLRDRQVKVIRGLS